jgi:hypothetical protein
MTVAVVAGALVGLGLSLLIRAWIPGRFGLAATVQRVDLLRQGQVAARRGDGGRRPGLTGMVGDRLADLYAERGWQQRSIRADLSLLGRSWEAFLATKVLLAAGAAAFATLVFPTLGAFGVQVSMAIPVWVVLATAAAVFMLPDVEVRRDAAVKRRDFRRVVAAYLDLVSMNLAGGRGLPEALMTAADVSDGWALQRIRDSLLHARITGATQWEALGRLGEELAVEELRDLAAALALVADDGAKIRASLTARAATMRHRELSEVEGKAGKQSQSMLVAQMLLAAGFLLFLTYPAATRIFQL